MNGCFERRRGRSHGKMEDNNEAEACLITTQSATALAGRG